MTEDKLIECVLILGHTPSDALCVLSDGCMYLSDTFRDHFWALSGHTNNCSGRKHNVTACEAVEG